MFDFLNNGLLSSESLKDLVTSVRPGEKILLDDEGIPVLRGGKKVNVNRGMGVYINLGDIRACDISSRCSASAFAAEGCEIITMEEHDESLEAFYMSLLGGESNV